MLNSLDDIKHAISRLPLRDRYRLTAWLFGSRDEIEKADSRVAEPPPPAYNAAPQQRHGSVEEYLEFEEASSIRHEYVAGQFFAMAGASMSHNLIAGNIFRAFGNHLEGGPCKTFMEGFKVRLKSNNNEFFYYPDVMVACERKGMEQYYLRYPKLIVEVLSPATENIDKREKFTYYKQIESLEEYVLVAQDRCQVTFFRRSGEWDPEEAFTAPEAVAEFRSIGLSMPVGRIYEGV